MPVLPNTKTGLQLGSTLLGPTTQQRTAQTTADLLQQLQVPDDFAVVPKTDYNNEIAELNRKTQELLTQSAQNAAYNATPNFSVNPVTIGGKGGGSPRLSALLRALGAQESGNRYGAVNRDSGAMGRWQVMPSNIAGRGRGWDYEVLGRDISTSQFLNSPKLQDAIVKSKFGNYLSRYGAKGALSAWYSGSPTRYKERTPQGGYPSVYNYIQQVLNRL